MAKRDPIKPQDERRLLHACDKLAQLVDEGSNPTEAAIKVARSEGFNENFTRLLCIAYNTGTQNAQREEATSALGKFAAFETIDVPKVLAELYKPEPTQKVASYPVETPSFDYDLRWRDWTPRRCLVLKTEKSAAVEVPPDPHLSSPDLLATRLRDLAAASKQAENLEFRLKADSEEAKNKLMKLFGKTAAYFRRPADSRLSLQEVEFNSLYAFGKQAKAIFDFCVNGNTKLRREFRGSLDSPPVKVAAAFNPSMEPYRTIKEAIDFAKASGITRAAKKAELARARIKEATAKVKLHLLLDKQGGAMSYVNSLVTPRTPNDLISSKVEELDDPDHDAQLNAIRAGAVLQDILANDEELKGYDPNDIINKYNELSAIGPQTVTRAAALRPMLARALAQAVADVDINRMIEVEQKLRDISGRSSPPPPSVPVAPAIRPI